MGQCTIAADIGHADFSVNGSGLIGVLEKYPKK